ncbi:flavin-containing monooxygenase [Rhodococcus sp. NM-2]|uniref:flavin-containing monooxygenase n=1 Tax=Rhodococcus sp. NM-2 TaxID=3401174 RepID=UPI003AAB79DF
MLKDDVDAVVVGGGVSGIAATIALKEQGLRDVALLEKSDGLGGVWHHNRYPGAACDVPSPVYSYRFALNPNWSRLFARGEEIRKYLEQVAVENGVLQHVRFKTELLEAAWDEESRRWLCKTSEGALRAKFLILGTGNVHSPSIPNVPGIDTFAGRSFHSSEWPDDFDPAGRRIAVVGTGASAIQFVPEIQPHAKQLVILQRTPPWILPKGDRSHPNSNRLWATLRQRILRTVIARGLDVVYAGLLNRRLIGAFERLSLHHLQKQVADPQLRAALTPNYRFGCKRMLLSSDFYPAVASENVDYVPSELAEVREGSVVADGREFPVDTIIWGTGFQFANQPMHERIRGRDGRTLAERWAGSPRGYLGATVAGYPNAFILLGPNTGTTSQIGASEATVRYLASAVETMRRKGFDTVDVRAEVEEAWVEAADDKLAKSVFRTGGCSSYYYDATGRLNGPWPGSLKHMAQSLSRFNVDDYNVTQPSNAPASESLASS